MTNDQNGFFWWAPAQQWHNQMQIGAILTGMSKFTGGQAQVVQLDATTRQIEGTEIATQLSRLLNEQHHSMKIHRLL